MRGKAPSYQTPYLSAFFFFFLMIRRPPRSTPLSLHDALPICLETRFHARVAGNHDGNRVGIRLETDRKSTRLNSSHVRISYAVSCLKKQKTIHVITSTFDVATMHPATGTELLRY